MGAPGGSAPTIGIGIDIDTPGAMGATGDAEVAGGLAIDMPANSVIGGATTSTYGLGVIP